MTDEPMEYDRDRRTRAHVTANIVAAIALIAITVMGIAYIAWGAP